MESSRRIRAVPGSSAGESQRGGTGGESPPPDPTPFLAALREAADHESAKEERVDGKTRGLITIAGAYFAIVQTVAFSNSDAVGTLAGSGRGWTIGLAIASVSALAFAIGSAVVQQWPRKHFSLPSDQIGQDLFDLLHGSNDNGEAVKKLAERYAGVTASRISANKSRVQMYYICAVGCLFAIGFTTAELVVSLMTRS